MVRRHNEESTLLSTDSIESIEESTKGYLCRLASHTTRSCGSIALYKDCINVFEQYEGIVGRISEIPREQVISETLLG